MILEVCVDNLQSALAAQNGGAHRIELCGDLSVGGVTPDITLIKEIARHITIPVMMMVRPRAGDFCYNDIEYVAMMQAIERAKNYNLQGVVFGLLNEESDIDFTKTKELVRQARPLEVTFHRAFDYCRDPIRAIEQLKLLNIDRLLTSGQKEKAIDGIALLSKLVGLSNGKLTVMPGSRISIDNIEQLVQGVGAIEYHGSCKDSSDETSADSVRRLLSKLQ